MKFDFLAEMSPEDRRELQARLALESREEVRHRFSRDEVVLWEALIHLFPHLEKAPLDRFARAYDNPGKPARDRKIQSEGRLFKYKDRAAQLAAILEKAAPRPTRLPVRMAICRVIMDCLAADFRAKEPYYVENEFGEMVEHRPPPFAPSILLGYFDRLEYAVDLAYPGYIEAGILDKVVKIFAAA
jgi:hypothetical protein